MEILLPFQKTSTNFQTHEHYCQWQTKVRTHIRDLLPSWQSSTNPTSGQYGKIPHPSAESIGQIWALRQWLVLCQQWLPFGLASCLCTCNNMATSNVLVEALEYIHHHPQHSPGNGCACYVAQLRYKGPSITPSISERSFTTHSWVSACLMTN